MGNRTAQRASGGNGRTEPDLRASNDGVGYRLRVRVVVCGDSQVTPNEAGCIGSQDLGGCRVRGRGKRASRRQATRVVGAGLGRCVRGIGTVRGH